ncbi:MAG: hypothetical protein LBF12_01225 [Christensenellaceae bacterium]|jgi:ferredoxin|nr:hypothetical protein [Christensenellaceae bacterium]
MKIFNNKKRNSSLKEELSLAGYKFPCGGMGLCGRCRIIASPEFEITEFDKKHISPEDLARGVRLACDKMITGDFEITDFLMLSGVIITKPDRPTVAVVVFDNHVEIAFVDNDILESIVVKNYPENTKELRSLISHYAIEYFEKYNVPKATTILIAGSSRAVAEFKGACQDVIMPSGEFFEGNEFDMPAEDVYIVATPNSLIGGTTLLEAIDLEVGELLTLVDSLIFVYNNDTSVVCTTLVLDDPKYRLEEMRGLVVKAACEYFVSEFMVEKLRVVSNLDTYIDLSECNVPIKHQASTALKNAALALTSNAYKTKLNKLSKKIVMTNVADDHKFQEIFTSKCNQNFNFSD